MLEIRSDLGFPPIINYKLAISPAIKVSTHLSGSEDKKGLKILANAIVLHEGGLAVEVKTQFY